MAVNNFALDVTVYKFNMMLLNVILIVCCEK